MPDADRRGGPGTVGATLLVLGAVPTAVGAGLLTTSLTSPAHLAAGIVQAAAMVVLVVGLLLVALAAGPLTRGRRRGGRTAALVGLIALAVGAAAGLLS